MAELYTPAFWRACAMHLAGGMSLSMFVLAPLWVRGLGGDDATVGLLLGIGGAAGVVTRPGVGVLLDAVGMRTVLAGANLLNALSYLPFLGIDHVGLGLGLAIAGHFVLWGACFAAFFTCAASLAPAARRTEAIAVFGIPGIASNGLGPILGEWIVARAGWSAFFLVAAGFAVVAFVLSRGLPSTGVAPVSRTPVPRGLAAVVSAPGMPAVLAATVLLGVAINAAFFFVAPFTRDLGIARTGPFFAAYSATSVLVRLFGRRLPDRFGPHRLGVPAFAAYAAGLAGLVALPAPGVLVLAGAACGFGHGVLFPILSGLVLARVPVGLAGSALSLHTAVLDLGAVVGTPICGALAQWAGYRVMFAGMAAGSLLGLVLLVADARRRLAPVPAAR